MSCREVEIAVVGAGPAGLCAALEAARAGAKALILDENHRPGGQLFKQIHKFFGSAHHLAGMRGFRIGEKILKDVLHQGAGLWLGAAVYDAVYDAAGGITLLVAREGRREVVKAQRLILATGATEKALPFPGWTLPGVMGAGAAQTFLNLYRVLPGKRVLIVGSGNVGLIVGYQLTQGGAEVVAVLESAPAIGGYEVHAAKLRRDDMGIDTIETAAAIAVLMEAGLLRFGDAAGALELVRGIGRGEPVGRVVGQGAAVTGRVFGVRRVPVVKGQSMAAYDPRALKGAGVTYATSPMGADHTHGNGLGDAEPLSGRNKVEYSRFYQRAAAVFDALGLCWFARNPVFQKPDILTGLVGAFLGEEISWESLVSGADALIAIERGFNSRAGFRREHDRLPSFMMREPLYPGGHAFDVPEEALDSVHPEPPAALVGTPGSETKGVAFPASPEVSG